MIRMPRIVAAANIGSAAEVEDAIASGESVDASDRDGRTALHHAVINADFRLVRLLLGLGASPTSRDAQGWTPLHFAAQNYSVKIAQALIRGGAEVDAADNEGNTPLSRAVFESRGRGDMIKMLIKNEANVHRENKHGVSPAGLADMIANYDVKQWLK